MKNVETLVMIVTFASGAYIVFASIYGLIAILRGRDKAYRARYLEYLRQKERVASRLENSRQSQKW
jgi:hypothetical protein